MRFLCLAVGALACWSCATGYHALDGTGGYSDARLRPDVWRVAFAGNGFTGRERAAEMALARAADVALAHGYRYFVVTDERDETDVGTYTTAPSSHGTTRMTFDGDTATATTDTTYSPGNTWRFVRPTRVLTVVGLREDIPGRDDCYDARRIWHGLATKYGLPSR